MPDVVTFGETMIMMVPGDTGSLKYVNQFYKQVGGAESNVAIGLARLGVSSGWFSRLGADAFGDYIASFIRGEGVDVSRVIRDPDAPTGLYFKEMHPLKESRVYYYRKHSAASCMTPLDIDADYIAGAKILHVSGITPALSESCRQTLYKGLEIARQNNVTISFDPNLRLKLWPVEKFKQVIPDIIRQVDILLPGVEEGQLLLDTDNEEDLIHEFLDMGPRLVVLKTGKKGAVVGTREQITPVPGIHLNQIVDPIGAGDGFAAGFLAATIKGFDAVKAVEMANAAGAMAMTSKGDVEGLPTWQELEMFMADKQEICR